ncbi:MAG: right-handed parallel beta-helix repeat-containing protein, partial [Deinococcota bacterium]
LSLEGIGADPSRTQANLLELDSGGLSLLQSRLVGAPGAGVWLAAEVGQVNIQDSDLAAHGAAAIYLDGASDVRLDNSSLRASQLGLDAPAGANVNAQLTRVEQNDIGIRLAAASQLYLEDAVLAFNKQAGLLARQQSQVVLTRVDVSDQQLGVAAFNSAGVSIVESSFRNHRDIGLALFDRVQAALSSSSYQRNTWGISATPSVDITLQDITMNDNRLAGMAPVTRRLGSLPSRWAKFGRADTVQAALAAAIPTLLVAPSSGLTTSAISPSASPSVSPSEAAIVASWFSEPEYRLVSSGQASASTSNVAQLVDVVLAADATEVPLYAQPSLDAEIVGTVSQGSRHSLLTSQADWFELAEGWLPRQYAFPTAELAASKAFNDALAAGATNWQLGPGVYRLSGPLELFGNITIQGAGERETLLLVEGVHLAEDSETSAPTPQGGSETVDSTALATQPTAASTSTPSTLADVAQTPSSRPALRYLGGGTLTIRDVTLASALVSEHTSTLLEVSPWAVAPAQLELQACHFTRAQSEQAASSRSLASSSSSSSADITTADITPAGQPGSQQGHGLVLAEHASLSMQHCRVTAHPSDGLHVRGQSQSTLVSSQFIANGGAGIAMYEQASLDVQNSHFEGNGLAAIYQSANEAALVSESTFAGVGVLRALEELSTDTDLQQFINNLPAGSGIRLPAGEFYLEQSLVIDKPLSLIGASPLTGDPVVQAQAVPTASDTTSTTTSATGSTTGQAANAVGQDAAPEAGSTVTRIISRAPDALLRFSGEGTLTLRNISLEHVDSIRADIIVVNSGELILEDSFVGGAVSDGLVEIGGTGVRFRRSAQGGQLRGNTIAGNAAFAVIVDGSASPIMSNNVIVDNGQGGALFTGNSGGQLRDNRIARNGPVGVRIEGLAAPLLEGNSIFDHSFNGLAYLDSASGTAKTNVIEVSGEAGVDVRGQAAPLLEGNTIMESYRGIFYTDNAAGTAKGNTLLNNRGYGIYNASNAEPTLEDNQFEGNTPGDIGP